MKSQAESSACSRQQLYDALRDYARSPGKSNVALHEPALLFASIRQILQIAADREPEPGANEERAALRRAACFFMRTALFFPGANHYTLMGLDRNFGGAELKDHYWLLMRLTHPDFAGTLPFAWPADTAARVNLAYEVLSSPGRRSEYEKDLAPAPKIPSPASVEQRRTALVVRRARVRISRSRFKQLVIVCSAAGTCAVLITLLTGGQEPVRLVQRSQIAAVAALPAAEPVAAAVQDSGVEVAQPEAAPAKSDSATHSPPQRSPTAVVSALVRPMFTSALSRPVGAEAVGRSSAPPQAPSPSPERPAAMLVPAAEPQPAAIPAPVSSNASPAQSNAVSVAAAAAPPVPRSAPVAGVTLGEAQPLLSNLLQQLESGLGARVISVLDQEARTQPAAQSLSRQYDSLVEGMRPVRLSRVEFRAEPADGRLLVTSHVYLQAGEPANGAPGKKIVLRAEFVSREGTVVMTGLSGVPDK